MLIEREKEAPMIQFYIDEERCTQCGECAEDCPAGVISMDEYPKITNEEGCYRCQHCLAVCPTSAVSVLGRTPDESTELTGNMPDADRLETLIKGRRSVGGVLTALRRAGLVASCRCCSCARLWSRAQTGVWRFFT